MIFFTALRIIFIITAMMGMSMLLPTFVAVCCKEIPVVSSFLIPAVSSWILGLIFYFIGRKKKFSLSTRNVFVIVAAAWIAIGLFGSLPLYFSGFFESFTDCVFESFSGFTTTGATILSDVEILPRSINLWRCQMHWLGGMGIIALTIALLPLLGVGGFQLIKAESTGPSKGKITPKMANTAKTLWLLYIGFTFVQFVALLFCKVGVVDALTIAFSTLGTGGMSHLNSSIAGVNSLAVEIICFVFMVLSGVNFSLYFYMISGRFSEVKKDSELKAYLSIIAVFIAVIAITLVPVYGSILKAIRYSSFQVATVITTTGFATADYTTWPALAQLMILFLFFIGGSSGSTAGGFKVIRHVVLFKQAKNEMLRMLHPHGVFGIRINGKPERKDIVFNVASFTCVYFAVVTATSICGAIAGLEPFTAFTAALSMVGNIGPAFGSLGPSCNYGFLPPALKWIYALAMTIGRLELYNLVILFMPDFWRK